MSGQFVETSHRESLVRKLPRGACLSMPIDRTAVSRIQVGRAESLIPQGLPGDGVGYRQEFMTPPRMHLIEPCCLAPRNRPYGAGLA